MYQIINVLTQNTISAETRDALFAEVDNLNARIKDGQESDVYKVILINDEGEILDTAFLEFPLKAYVDEVLKDFGTEKATKGKKKGGLLSRLNFGKEDKDKALLEPTAPEAPEEEAGTKDEAPLLTDQVTVMEEAPLPWQTEGPTLAPREVDITEAAQGSEALLATTEPPQVLTTAPTQVPSLSPTQPPTEAPTEAPQITTSTSNMSTMKTEMIAGINEEIKLLDKQALAVLNRKQELLTLLENLENTPL